MVWLYWLYIHTAAEIHVLGCFLEERLPCSGFSPLSPRVWTCMRERWDACRSWELPRASVWRGRCWCRLARRQRWYSGLRNNNLNFTPTLKDIFHNLTDLWYVSGLTTFWRQPQDRENRIEATANLSWKPLCPSILLDNCPLYTFGHLDHILWMSRWPQELPDPVFGLLKALL